MRGLATLSALLPLALAAASFKQPLAREDVQSDPSDPRTENTQTTTATDVQRPFGIIEDKELFSSQSFDYLIVGGGSAGLVLANRLSANPHYTVGVIEAGGYFPDEDLINVPGLFGRARNNATFDWLIKTTPQPGVHNRRLEQPRGKFLGGSSGLTYHNYARGSKDEYDAWEELGNPGWNWENIKPHFTKLDDVTPGPVGWLPGNDDQPGLANARDGAVGGPIKVGFNGNNTAATPYIYDIHQAFLNRGGYVNSDPEGGNSTGLTLTARSVDPKTNTRSYSTTGYLQPVLERTNLLVLINAEATKVLFDESTVPADAALTNTTSLLATGIEYGSPTKPDERFTANVTREVILSAGSLKSPQLLELSGVGNKTLLESLEIPVVLDIPEVGENLQDHLEFNTDFLLKEDAPYETWDIYRNSPERDQLAWEEYKANGTGVYNASPATLSFFPLQTFPEAFNVTDLLEELDRELASADLSPIRKKHLAINRRHLAEGKVTQVEFSVVPKGGIASSNYQAIPGRSYINIVTFLLRPYSAGNVHINTTDPFAIPLVDPKYNQFSFDWKVAAQWTRFMRTIMMETEPTKEYVERPNQPPASYTTLQQWDDFCREWTISVWHPVGTTSMASRDIGGVVDPKMKVYGTQNLRVVDAGSMPINIATHTVATVYAMAEKISDDIIADRRVRDGPQVPARTLESLKEQYGEVKYLE